MKRNFHQNTTSAFKGAKINISDNGQQVLGVVIGSNDFKQECLKRRGKNQRMVWGSIKILDEIAKSEPHTAYS